jgi:WG containing repeat
LFPPTFDYGYPFREGLASFREGDLWGAMDRHGNVVIPRCSGQLPLVFAEKLAEFSSGAKRGVLNNVGQVWCHLVIAASAITAEAWPVLGQAHVTVT